MEKIDVAKIMKSANESMIENVIGIRCALKNFSRKGAEAKTGFTMNPDVKIPFEKWRKYITATRELTQQKIKAYDNAHTKK